MRIIRVVLAIAVLCCATTYADSMQAEGTASGNVVLYFSSTTITGTFNGTFLLAGYLELADVVTAFSASGWARGAGSGDSVTLDLEAQATFAATGVTETGEHISVQGGVTLSGLTADVSGSSGSGIGEFFAAIFIGGSKYYAGGNAGGSASGAFVIPEDPYSMELAGDGTFDLAGDVTLACCETTSEDPADAETQEQADMSLFKLLPWDTSTWPEDLLAELLEILMSVVEIPELEEASPADN